jgi:hypothetical protein
LLGAWSLTWAGAAAAQDAEPIHLTYDVPAGCPSRDDFLDMIAKDGGRVVVAPDERTARSFAVHVEGSDTVVGRLSVRDEDGNQATREIAIARCDDVVRSLAVLVALAAEPSRANDDAPAPAATDDAPPPGPTPEPPVPSLGAASAPEEAAPPRIESDDGASSMLRPRKWRFGFSGAVTIDKGVGSEADPGAAMYFEAVDDTPSFFGPAMRFGVVVPWGQGTGSGISGGTVFQRVSGRVDACPWHVVLQRPWADDAFTLTACARLDVGQLKAAAYGDPGSGTASIVVDRPWVAPAALLRLRWTTPRIFFEAELGVSVPLVRENFGGVDDLTGNFSSNNENEVPATAATGSFGFGWFVL